MLEHNTLIRAGDRVRLDGRDGKEGTVEAFGTVLIHRVNNSGLEPGIYYDPRKPIVDFGDGQRRMLSGGYHFVYDDIIRGRRQAHDIDPYRFWRETAAQFRLGDLPETAFWEGDKVRIIADEFTQPSQFTPEATWLKFDEDAEGKGDPDVGYVRFVYYGESDYDNRTPSYSIYMPKSENPREAVRTEGDNLNLVQPGRVRAFYAGEPIDFGPEPSGDEVDFYKMVGAYIPVRNGRTGSYAFDYHDHHNAIIHRIGDIGLGAGNRPFGGGEGQGLIRFNDRAVGERARALYLKASTPLPSAES